MEKPEARKEISLDLRGLKCPMPALRTRRALGRLGHGATLVVATTDPLAALDIPHLVNQTGDHLLAVETGDGGHVFRIRKSAASGEKA